MTESRFDIVGLNYFSVYLKDYEEAVEFYSGIFGPDQSGDPRGMLKAWQMGSTYLTVFPAKDMAMEDVNPRNAEFAIQVGSPDEVDRLHKAFVDAGATNGWDPRDTEMYEPMRFAYVDDPFGMRIDIYCPIDRPPRETPAT